MKFAVEFSMFFVMLSLVAVPLGVARPELTLSVQSRTVTLWHVVVPSALTLTGAAWCWSV